MISTASKFIYGVAGAAVAAAFVYGTFFGDDRLGVGLLLAIVAAAFVAGTTLNRSPDLAPGYDPAEPPKANAVTVDTARAPRPSIWPLLAVLAFAVIAGSALGGKPMFVAGCVVTALALAGWFAQSWREDPAWSPRLTEVADERVVTPWALPVVSLALVLFIAICMSRVLLAVDEKAAWPIAVAVGFVGMAVFFVIAYRPKLSKMTLGGLAGLAAVALVAAGIVSAAKGERSFEAEESATPHLELSASGTAFDQKALTVKGGSFDLRFVNHDTAIFHNVSIYSADGKTPIYAGSPIVGGHKTDYKIGDVGERARIAAGSEPLQAGTYQFRCDFHAAAMVGTLTVEPAAAAE